MFQLECGGFIFQRSVWLGLDRWIKLIRLHCWPEPPEILVGVSCGSSEILVNRFWSYTYAGQCGNYSMIWSHICTCVIDDHQNTVISPKISCKPLYIVIKKPLPTRHVSSIRMKPYQGPYRYKAWSPALPIMKNANMVSTWQRCRFIRCIMNLQLVVKNIWNLECFAYILFEIIHDKWLYSCIYIL